MWGEKEGKGSGEVTGDGWLVLWHQGVSFWEAEELWCSCQKCQCYPSWKALLLLGSQRSDVEADVCSGGGFGCLIQGWGLWEAWKGAFSVVAMPGVLQSLCRKDYDG